MAELGFEPWAIQPQSSKIYITNYVAAISLLFREGVRVVGDGESSTGLH